MTLSVETVTAKDGNSGACDYTVSDSGATFYINTVGEYLVSVKAEDEYGNFVTTSIPAISLDQTAPTFSGIQSSYVLAETDSEPDYLAGVTAADEIDGDLTSSVVIDDSAVDYDTAGTYEITYSVKDSSGNSVQQSASVTVQSKVEETTAVSTGCSSGGTVYITKTGSKYHKSSCRYLSQSKISISKSEAIAQEYEACKVCKP